MRLTALIAAAAAAVAAGAQSKKVAPPRVPQQQQQQQPTRQFLTAPCDLTIPGTWTGFEGTKPLYDSYELTPRGPEYPAGSFSAVYITGGPSWSLGLGRISGPANGTATITFDEGAGATLTGNVSADCSTILWDNDSAWKATSALPKRVHIVHMWHLDVGYNGIPETGLIANILNRYFGIYFPRGVAIAAAMRALNSSGGERYIMTTHSYLVDFYLNCPSNWTMSGILVVCPPQADVDAFKAAFAMGDISFHAAPFNIQYGGAFSQDMLDAIFQQPKRIAAQVGMAAPKVASLRDVPGAPRGIVPGLARNGIRLLTIGDNNYAPSPQLPNPSVWLDKASGASVVVHLEPQNAGYPNNVGPSPTDPGGLDPSTCIQSHASAAVLCFAFRTDNSGPPESVEEVLNYLDIARWVFPGAEVFSSTFEAWWDEFEVAVPSLPVVSSEMGETWLTGFASDPPKNALYRTAAREYSACLAAKQCDPANDPRIHDFHRYLMKMPEHTWGLPSIYDNANYSNVDFHAARAAGVQTYVNSEMSWSEQREFFNFSVAALLDHPLAAQITDAAQQLVPSLPNPAAGGLAPVAAPPSPLAVLLPGGGSVSIAFDAATGAVNHFTSPSGAALADATHVFGRLVYQTLNDTDTDTQHITVDGGDGCCCCYGWDQLQQRANPVSSRTSASLVGVWAAGGGGSSPLSAPATFLVRLSLPSVLNTNYGAPSDIWANYTVTLDGQLSIDLQMFGKTPTRIGEAIYFDFSTPPMAADPSAAWLADVLGVLTDPLDVVERGSQRQHGVGAGVAYLSPSTGAGLAVDTLDLPVFSPWTAANTTSTLIVPFYPLKGPVLGFSCVLFANAYNTNFPLYSVDDAFRMRFVVRSVAPSEELARQSRAARSLGEYA